MMTSRSLVLSSFVYHDIVRLDTVVLPSNGPPSGCYFLHTVPMQVLRIFLVVTADSAVKQFLSCFLQTITAVNIFSIVELFKTPIVSMFLLVKYRLRTMFRMKLTHYKSIVDMRLLDI